ADADARVPLALPAARTLAGLVEPGQLWPGQRPDLATVPRPDQHGPPARRAAATTLALDRRANAVRHLAAAAATAFGLAGRPPRVRPMVGPCCAVASVVRTAGFPRCRTAAGLSGLR